MNNNTAAVVGTIVVLAILAGGVFMYTQNNPSTTATSTPVTGTTDTDPVTGTTPDQTRTAGMPTATTNATVNPTGTTAVVVGGVVPNGAFTTYWYEYGVSSNLGLTTGGQNIGSGYAELAAPTYITGLANNTLYSYRLVAQNQFGKSTGATYTFRTDASVPAPVGGIPSAKTIAASSVSRTGATINGEVSPNKAATLYWFEYGNSANLGAVTAAQTVSLTAEKSSVSIALPNLSPANTYYFRLNAQNQFGTVNGTILTFNTQGPAASAAPVVTTQVASPVATTTATLRGTVNPNGSQTTYWFEYSTNAQLGSILMKTTDQRSIGIASNTASVEASISSLRSKTTYYYHLVAKNSSGTMSTGDRLSFKTN